MNQALPGPPDAWEAIAESWAKWWPIIERGAEGSNHRIVELARVQPGHIVLDLASGVGEPAASAAGAVGPGGRVIATDISPTMVRLGSQRLAEMDLANVDYRLMDAQHPDFEEASLDALICRWGLMFLPDLDAALEHYYRILKPGAWLATAVWPEPERAPAISCCLTTFRQLLALPPPGPEERSAFELADIEDFSRRLRQAGFVDLECEAVPVTYRFESDEQFVTVRREISMIGRAVDNLPADQRDAAWQMMRDALGPYRQADGSLMLDNETICIAARRPHPQ